MNGHPGCSRSPARARFRHLARPFLAAFLAAAFLAAIPTPADAGVPVRVRLIKGSRQGPPRMDPALEDLRRQLSPLAYVRWDQLQDRRLDLVKGKTEFVDLPGGDMVGLTLQASDGNALTFEVSLASRNTQSRLTVEKGQRIVHQVTGEKDGAAYFLTVHGS